MNTTQTLNLNERRSGISIITPDKAKAMLENNPGNRSLNYRTIDMYARDMKEGNWKTTHQGLLLGAGKAIIDGQHRLHAVIQSGVPIRTMVTIDESLSSALDLPIDVGSTRSASFILKAERHLVAIARLAYSVSGNNGASYLSTAELKKWTDFFEPYWKGLALSATSTSTKHFSRSSFQLAAIVQILNGGDPEYVLNMYRNLVLENITELSRYSACIYKEIVRKGSTYSPRELFVIGMRAFDVKRKDQIRFRFDSTKDDYSKELNLLDNVVKHLKV